MPRAFALLVVCVIAALWSSPADACTCAQSGSACEEFSRVDAVFVGRVVGIENATDSPKFGTRRVQIAVVEALRGVSPGTVTVRTYPANGGSCGYPFVAGETYLVYAFQPEPGVLVATMCGRTRVASEVAEEISYLRTLARPGAGTTARIKGQLQTLSWPPPAQATADGFPRVRLTATGSAGAYSATSNPKGEFTFESLPLGRYELKAETPQQFEAETKGLDLFHGESCSVTYVTIWHSGRITGRVVGHQGTVVAELGLELLRSDPSSGGAPDAFIAARTAGDGTFEFRRVPPGEFTLRVAKGLAFHPGVTTREQAARLSVAPGQHVRLDDFRLPARVGTVTIEGIALMANGKPAAGAEVSVRPTTGADNAALPLTTAEDGSFRVTVLAGATYTIQATRSTFEGARIVSVESGEAPLRTTDPTRHVRVVLKPRR
jgi:hypothetical protein